MEEVNLTYALILHYLSVKGQFISIQISPFTLDWCLQEYDILYKAIAHDIKALIKGGCFFSGVN